MGQRAGQGTSSGGGSEERGGVGVPAVAIAMLGWAMFGKPPYSFFGILKWAVTGASVYLSWVGYRASKAFAPAVLVLLSVAGIHVFGKMRREDWASSNWAAIAALGVAAVVVALFSRRTDGGQSE